MSIITDKNEIILSGHRTQLMVKCRVVKPFARPSLEEIVHGKELRILLPDGILFQIATLEGCHKVCVLQQFEMNPLHLVHDEVHESVLCPHHREQRNIL